MSIVAAGAAVAAAAAIAAAIVAVPTTGAVVAVTATGVRIALSYYRIAALRFRSTGGVLFWLSVIRKEFKSSICETFVYR